MLTPFNNSPSFLSLLPPSPPPPQKLDDTNPTVREAGMECLGTLMRVVGDRPMNSYVENVDKSKMTKVSGGSWGGGGGNGGGGDDK